MVELRQQCLGDICEWITPHTEYAVLGSTAENRLHAYRELFRSGLGADDLHAIRKATHYCLPLGNDRFRQQIEEKLGRIVGHATRGRPSKTKVEHGCD